MDVTLVTFKANGERCNLPVVGPVTTVGRHSECDIEIQDANVSRRHFQILRQGENLGIKDMGSSNGTFLNEQTHPECNRRRRR